jgi:hypothetical protein
MTIKSYNISVFLNCPFDDIYRPLFDAAVFTITRCKFNVRCALEESDSSEIRLNKIFRMISDCKFGVHDISMTELDIITNLPRFNMPFELGLFLSARHFDNKQDKICLVFEKQSHTYEKYISDIKGQDISSHNNDPKTLIKKIRDWLDTNSKNIYLPGGSFIWKEYNQFQKWLAKRCKILNLEKKELTFNNYVQLVYEWIELNNPNDIILK